MLLSAVPTEIVARIALSAGLERGSGTTAEIDSDGRYTAVLSGPFCYREGKVEVMRALAEEHGL